MNFNLEYNILLKLIITVLKEDHLISIEKSLLFLYKYLWVLGPGFKEEIWNRMFSKKFFFKFFLHWSFSIRKIFHHLIIYNYFIEDKLTNQINTYVAVINKERIRYNQFMDEKRQQISKSKKFNNFRKYHNRPSTPFPSKLAVYSLNALKEYNSIMMVFKDWKAKYKNLKDNKIFGFIPNLSLKMFKDETEKKY